MLTKHSAYSFLLLLLSPPLHADTLTDGTLGPRVQFNDSHFEIGESLGQRVGPNLFHSFERFNVPTNGSATFTGSEGIQNVLARVTGPNASDIDGTLRSTIPDANLYLMNPNGIRFGEHARLDVLGSFHATTADTIRLGQGGEFNARTPTNSLLTVAAPEAFGFLSDMPAPVEMQGSYLQVLPGKMISTVAGDVSIKDAILFASEGQINLISVASHGEVITSQDASYPMNFPKNALYPPDSLKLGKITISQCAETNACANLDVSGEGGGQIFIRGGQFHLQGGFIFSDTYGDKEGQGIDIAIDGPINLSGGSRITADSVGNGKGGKISITSTSSFSMNTQITQLVEDEKITTITTNAYAQGDAGDIRIQALQLEITNGSITSSPFSLGHGGNIFIEVGKLLLKDVSQIQGITFNEGQGGNINIQADSILMSADPELYELGLANFRVPLSSSISVGVEEGATGAGGNLSITANYLELQGNAFIISETLGPGKGGDITIDVRDTFTISDKTGKTRSGLASLSDNYGADAGDITVKAGRLVMDEGGFINSRAYQPSASGGNIEVIVKENLFLFDSTISATAQGDQPGDNGGNLTITGPHLFLMGTHSRLFAKANVGKGGHIHITADNFLNCAPSTAIDASSDKGIDGEVRIDAFQIDLTGLLTQPSLFHHRFSPMNKPRCSTGRRKPGEESRFSVQMQEMLHPSPTDLRFFSPVEW